MTTTFVDEVYSSIMNMWHDWTYDEITELMEMLDNKQEELSLIEDNYTWPEEIFLPDEWDYGIIERENCEALIDNIQ